MSSNTKTLRVVVVGNASQAAKALKGLGGDFDRTGSKGATLSGRLSGAFSRIGQRAATGLAVASAASAGFVYNVGASYEQSLNKIGALADLTDAELAPIAGKLEKQSALFAKYGFSTGDAAGGVVELVKAGQSLDQAMKSLNGTMVLAKAGELSVADASSLVANTLNTFKMEASDAAHVANSLANAANASSADVSDLREALAMTALSAKQAGLDIDQTNAYLAILHNNGMKGSDAGTSLKTMLLRLSSGAPVVAGALEDIGISVYDSQGRMRDMSKIIGREFIPALDKLSDEERAQTLFKIFGQDSIRAANALFGEGSKKIDQVTESVMKAGTAERFAAAQSKGLSGALKVGKAQAISFADALYRKVSPSLEKLVENGLSTFSEFASELGSTLAPVMDSLQNVFEDMSGESAGLEKSLDSLMAVVGALAKVVEILADGWASLPSGLKSFIVQGGIAALVMWKLSTAATSAGGKILELKNRVTGAQLSLASFGRASQVVAGAGGMMAMQAGAESGNKALSALGGALTGAATGAAIGSAVFPGVGTAIGGVVGAAGGAAIALFSMDKAQKATKVSSGAAAKAAEDFRLSLDQLTGAATRNTRQLVRNDLQKSGMIDKARLLGIETRDLIGASLGEEAAIKRVNAAIKGNPDLVSRSSHADVMKFLYDRRIALSKDAKAIRENAGDLQTWKQSLRGIPKNVFTALKQKNFKINARQLDVLKAKYNLQPKQVSTISRVLGVPASKKKIDELGKKIKDVGKAKPSNAWASMYGADLSKVKKTTDKMVPGINDSLKKGTAKARPNINPFANALKSNLLGLRGPSASSANATGSQIGIGFYNGLGVWISPLEQRAVLMIRNAIAAAKKEADVRSPSRKTTWIGDMIGSGLALGIGRSSKHVVAATRSVVNAVPATIKSVMQIASPSKVAKGLGAWITRGLGDGIKDAPSVQRMVAIIGSVSQRVIKAFRSGRISDRVKDNLMGIFKRNKARMESMVRQRLALQDRLDKAEKELGRRQAKLAALREQQTSVVESSSGAASDYGRLTNAFSQDGQSNSVSAILSRFTKRLANIRKFRANLNALRGRGLARSLIEQIAGEGPDNGGAIAAALVRSSGGQIASLSSIGAQIESESAGIGSDAGSTYTAEIRAAQARVNEQQPIVNNIKVEVKGSVTAEKDLVNAISDAVRQAISRADKRNGKK